ncbi:hypothetical protein HMPREF1991_02099 [Hoylesella loescheii DSM 19665 = JCM 12249 = ATCC 15930]|uniref:Uncharacterized protein n=1 Tax=Hoylesella loescheii DSM 19665 = JCM 12249 = ATCC 15930 TaxID=1122985 RepID=A0A069QIE7_HOYLO|nr:hypothetical protein HMPREF1991_02099 [Hoylesella loescheii DSM 19665 = JCM 12249 = ATCC 15930]
MEAVKQVGKLITPRVNDLTCRRIKHLYKDGKARRGKHPTYLFTNDIQ